MLEKMLQQIKTGKTMFVIHQLDEKKQIACWYVENYKQLPTFLQTEKIKELQSRLESHKTSDLDNDEIKRIIKSFLSSDTPSKEIINRLIEKVYIDKERNIRIHYRIRKLNHYA